MPGKRLVRRCPRQGQQGKELCGVPSGKDGYEHWAKIHNLKQAARTLNFLTENRIDSYAELSAKIAEVNAASEQAAGALKGVERRLADMAVLIKNVTTYQKTKPVYDAYRRAKDKAAYRAAHESSIILFEAAAKAVKPALIGGKLPNVAALQAEYAALGEQKEKLYADYGKLKKQVKVSRSGARKRNGNRNIDSHLYLNVL